MMQHHSSMLRLRLKTLPMALAVGCQLTSLKRQEPTKCIASAAGYDAAKVLREAVEKFGESNLNVVTRILENKEIVAYIFSCIGKGASAEMVAGLPDSEKVAEHIAMLGAISQDAGKNFGMSLYQCIINDSASVGTIVYGNTASFLSLIGNSTISVWNTTYGLATGQYSLYQVLAFTTSTLQSMPSVMGPYFAPVVGGVLVVAGGVYLYRWLSPVNYQHQYITCFNKHKVGDGSVPAQCADLRMMYMISIGQAV